MAFIRVIISFLLMGAVPALLGVFLMNRKNIYDFQQLAKKTNLNFALPKRKNFLSTPKPSLVGDYKGRSVSLRMKQHPRVSSQMMSEFVMNCNTGNLMASIEPKKGIISDYIYQNHGQSDFKSILTGYTEFDKHFFVVIKQKESLDLLTKDVYEFLLKRRNNITFSIKIQGYEIIAEDESTQNWVNSEGGIAENTLYMLNFMSELADLLECKRLK